MGVYIFYTPVGEILMNVERFARIAGLLLLGLLVVGHAHGQSIGAPVLPLGAGPWVFDTAAHL